MRKIYVFALAIALVVSAFAALSVSNAVSNETEYVYDASEIKNLNSWIKNGTLQLAQNGGDDVARFVPNQSLSNGYGITVDIPVDEAKYVVVKYESNLLCNSIVIDYMKESTFNFNNVYGSAKHTPAPLKKVAVFNMATAVSAAKEAGEASIKYVKLKPWSGGGLTYDGNLSDYYFDVYSVAFFADANSANAYADELCSYSYVDYNSLPETDAHYLANDLNDSFAWIKNGYRAYISGALDNPFKYVPDTRASNGIGFKVDVPTAKARYAVVRYYTNVIERRFQIAYSHDDTFDYNYQYGKTSVAHAQDKRLALFDMSSSVNAASTAGVSTIEYLKLLPWEGQEWAGDTTAIAKNFFNVYSVAFFENKSEAEAYMTALEAALPPLELDQSYDNTGIVVMPGVAVDDTALKNMIAAFKQKEENFASATENKLIIYPEYPEQIGRNYDYSVTVSQGDESHPIPVYNELRQGGGTRNPYGDDYRRFCEFAFQGDDVRIDITVNMDFSEYTLIPAAKNIPNEVNGNVISVYVSEPMQLILRLGNGLESNNTSLAIFVDPPEENVPVKDPDNDELIYIEGWYEVEGNELVIEEKDNVTVYIAPGAVCNARIRSVKSNNLTIMGRGMVRDPYDTRSNNDHGKNYNVNIAGGNNIRIDGIKIVDCRFYHLYMGGVKNAEIYNVKIFSNQISTDGFPISGTNIYMHDSYADVGDDVFTGSGTNKHYEDMLVGSTCGIFSLSGIRSNETYKDIHIFRADEAIFKNYYGTGVFIGAVFENIYAVDCPFTPYLLTSKDQGDGTKHFVFNNISLRAPTGVGEKNTPFGEYTGTVINIADGGPFRFDFENLYIDGELVRSSSDVKVNDRSSSGTFVTVTENTETQTGIPLKTNTKVLDEAYIHDKTDIKALHNGENLIPNGNFEGGAAPWVCVDFSYVYLTDDASHGENAMYIPASQDANGEDQRGGVTVYITDAVNRGGAGEYLVEFYAKKAPGFEGSDISAVFGYYYGEITETTAMTYKSPSSRFTLTEEWQKFSYVARVEASEVNRAALSIHRGSGNTFPPLDFYLDDVSVVKLPVKPGDVSGDEGVTSLDAIVIMRALAGWNGYADYVNIANADMNGDYEITSLDAILLARHLAGWKGYEDLIPSA